MGLDRDFLAMLGSTVEWEHMSGQDQWGNDGYASVQNIAAFVDATTSRFGTGERYEQIASREELVVQIITDYVGVAVGDRFTLDEAGVLYVESFDTVRDEDGTPLCHMVNLTTERRG